MRDEEARLAAVRRYDILDTPPDGAFDRVTALAARLFGVPIAIISIVDGDRIWFKSHHGTEVDQIGREPGLYTSAVMQTDVFASSDERLDEPQLLADPLVAGEHGFRFYAAAPRLWGISPSADQQLAGVIMFGVGNLVYFVAISVIFLRLFESPQRDEEAAEAG